MASAAAVAASSHIPDDVAHDDPTDPNTVKGDITTATVPLDEEVPDNLDDVGEDDDIVRMKRRGGIKRNLKQGEEVQEPPDDDDDLFGDGVEDELKEEAEELENPSERRLDDEELDSGDDEGRADRAASDAPAEPVLKEATVEFPVFGRQPIPEPSDGEMYLLKVPRFMSIEPSMFDAHEFQVPTTEHHSRKEPPAAFSAFNTAMSTIRWRHSPSKRGDLQSNGRILRWADGSLTLQLASDPEQQYEIDGNALAPPQRNPPQPTPTSIKPDQREKGGQQTFTYLTAPYESVGLLKVTHRITAGLSVLPSASTTDDALEKLQNSLAAAVQNKNMKSGGGIELIKVQEDPELAKKKAEVAEREKLRAQKRREAAETRERERSSRALGRAGLGSQRYSAGGLTAGMLEDEELGGPKRPRAKPKSRRQYNDEYSSDEDLGRRRGNFANDDYEVDDFVAGSDEEEEVDAESEEEDVDDGIREEKKVKSPKRTREESAGDEDAEAAEEDDVVQAPKAKRRRAVLDEDDEE